MKDQWTPVSSDERVFRRILNKLDYFNASLPRPVTSAAFRPTDHDTDGISVYRPACGAQAAAVADGPSPCGYYVVSLRVSAILALDIEGLRPTVEPTPDNGPIPGHAAIPELNVRLRDGNKRQYRLLATALATLVTNADIVHQPA